jgi:hypothetical protein
VSQGAWCRRLRYRTEHNVPALVAARITPPPAPALRCWVATPLTVSDAIGGEPPTTDPELSNLIAPGPTAHSECAIDYTFLYVIEPSGALTHE